jgi:tetratricopeptide (TPR) repeat protein
MIDVDAVTDLVNIERYEAARAVVEQARPEDDRDRWEIHALRLRLMTPFDPNPSWRLPPDSFAVSMMRHARSQHAPPDGAARCAIYAAGMAVARRLRGQAERLIGEAERLVGPGHSEIVQAKAGLEMVFDNREEARSILEQGLTTDPHLRLNRTMAVLLYIVGDLDGAVAQARTLAGSSYRLNGADIEAQCHSARGDFEAEIEARTRAIEISPDGIQVAGRHLARAHARAAIDDLEGTRADLVAAVDTSRESFREAMEEHIRRRLDALDRAPAGAAHKRLHAFPTIVQKWNYCGPAVLELCLRYLGLEMDQDFVAAAVKEEEGTPMYSISRFLREQGIENRRIEATPEKIKAAVDLGFPVIVEDDYVNTGHVAVAIGYDDRLEAIIAADPGTRAPRLRSFESREDTSKALRHSGILVMGPSDAITAEQRAATDAAGLVDQEHILILDEIARRDRAADAAFEQTMPLEAAGLAARAMALQPDYPRAALIRVGNLLLSYQEGLADISIPTLLETRVRFPRFGDVREVASKWLANRGAYAQALVEAVAATEEEPLDARAQALTGTLLLSAGERALAHERFVKAVLAATHVPDGTVGLSTLLRSELAERFRKREVKAEGRGRFLFDPSAGDSSWTEFDDSHLAALADWVSEAALAMAPDNPNALLARADVEAILGRCEAADPLLAKAIDVDPAWNTPWIRRARVLEVLDRRKDLRVFAESSLKSTRDSSQFWLMISAVLDRVGDLESAIAIARRGIEVCQDRSSLVEAWFDALSRHLQSNDEAAKRLVELARERVGDRWLVYRISDLLISKDLGMYVEALLGRLLEANPHDEQARQRLHQVIRTGAAKPDGGEVAS